MAFKVARKAAKRPAAKQPYRIEADADTYLFVGSDKTVQEKLGLFRERRGNA